MRAIRTARQAYAKTTPGRRVRSARCRGSPTGRHYRTRRHSPRRRSRRRLDYSRRRLKQLEVYAFDGVDAALTIAGLREKRVCDDEDEDEERVDERIHFWSIDI